MNECQSSRIGPTPSRKNGLKVPKASHVLSGHQNTLCTQPGHSLEGTAHASKEGQRLIGDQMLAEGRISKGRIFGDPLATPSQHKEDIEGAINRDNPCPASQLSFSSNFLPTFTSNCPSTLRLTYLFKKNFNPKQPNPT